MRSKTVRAKFGKAQIYQHEIDKRPYVSIELNDGRSWFVDHFTPKAMRELCNAGLKIADELER